LSEQDANQLEEQDEDEEEVTPRRKKSTRTSDCVTPNSDRKNADELLTPSPEHQGGRK
jgi:hypothetical protein